MLFLALVAYWMIVFYVIDNWIFKAAGFVIGCLIPGGIEILAGLCILIFMVKCYQTAGSLTHKKTS